MENNPLSATTELHNVSTHPPLEPPALNRWIVEKIESYILRPTLEMNSGFGSISAELAEKAIPIRLSDQNKSNRDQLRQRFKGIEAIRRVYNIDFCHPEFESFYSEALGCFGTLIALNVLENGYYDSLALRNARHFLRPRGRLILIAPAYTSIFCGLDEDPTSWQHFNFQALKNLLKHDFEIITTHYLNLTSPLGLSVLAVARRI